MNACLYFLCFVSLFFYVILIVVVVFYVKLVWKLSFLYSLHFNVVGRYFMMRWSFYVFSLFSLMAIVSSMAAFSPTYSLVYIALC